MNLNEIGRKNVRYWLMRISNNNHDSEWNWLKELFDKKLNDLCLDWNDFSIKWDVNFQELNTIVLI